MSLFNAAETPLLLDVSPNAPRAALHDGDSIVTGIVFGLVPAFASTRVDLTPALKDGAATRRAPALVDVACARRLASRAEHCRARHRRAARAHALQPEDARCRLHAGQSPAGHGRYQRHAGAGSVSPHRLQRDARSGAPLPGVQSVSGSTIEPDSHLRATRGRWCMPKQLSESIEDNAAFTNNITPEYFDTLGIRLLAAAISPTSTLRSSPHVAVVNETMAKFWAGDPIRSARRSHSRAIRRIRSRSSASCRTPTR